MNKLILSPAILITFLISSFGLYSQNLVPGFNKAEYTEVMKIGVTQVDTAIYISAIPKPKDYRLIYRSQKVALENSWDLWVNDKGVAVISISPTTSSKYSWMENFYAAMLPAKGSLQIDDSIVFSYQLASNPNAAVHAGWLTGLAYLSADIMQKMDSCVNNGITQFIICGHSQGGAISILLTAYLRNLGLENHFSKPIVIKTYSSAAPKPGNLYFAYDYEAATYGGWAFTIINSADWVPEAPVSIQCVRDFNNCNPFVNIDKMIRKQSFPKNIVMRVAYHQMASPLCKAQKRHEKFLGAKMYSVAKSHLKGQPMPQYIHSSNYTRCGQQVILLADEQYYKIFPQDQKMYFIHHAFEAYLYLLDKLPPAQQSATINADLLKAIDAVSHGGTQ